MPYVNGYGPELPPCPPEEYSRHVIADIQTRKPVAFICWHCFEVFDWKTHNIFSHSLACPVSVRDYARESAERKLTDYRRYLRNAAIIRRDLKAYAGRGTRKTWQRRLEWWKAHGPEDCLKSEDWFDYLFMMWALERKVAGLPVCPTDKELLIERG